MACAALDGGPNARVGGARPSASAARLPRLRHGGGRWAAQKKRPGRRQHGLGELHRCRLFSGRQGVATHKSHWQAARWALPSVRLPAARPRPCSRAHRSSYRRFLWWPSFGGRSNALNCFHSRRCLPPQGLSASYICDTRGCRPGDASWLTRAERLLRRRGGRRLLGFCLPGTGDGVAPHASPI